MGTVPYLGARENILFAIIVIIIIVILVACTVLSSRVLSFTAGSNWQKNLSKSLHVLARSLYVHVREQSVF